jgi:hypothetical protein
MIFNKLVEFCKKKHYEERRNKVKVKHEPSRRDHMLEAFHPYDDHRYMKICRR